MPWFVPQDGDPMMCGLQAKQKDWLKKGSERPLHLSVRVERLLDREKNPDEAAREVGRLLYEAGALKEPPANLKELLAVLENDPLMWDWLESNGLSQEYRPASPDETRRLESLSAREWASLFGESSLQ
jgi:hypothetical protein